MSRDLEITEIADRVMKRTAADNKALLFENVEGFEMPVAINLFGTGLTGFMYETYTPNGFDNLPTIPNLSIPGLSSIPGVGPVVAAVDPDGGQARSLRRNVIVEQALGDVQ